MKIQPVVDEVDLLNPPTNNPNLTRHEPAKLVLKSRFRRLFDRQLPSVLRINNAAVEKPPQTAPFDDPNQFEPSSVCLDKMVQSYLEDNNNNNNNIHHEASKQQHFTRGGGGGGRHRCNCFNGNAADDSSEDDFDSFYDGGSGGGSFSDASDILKGLIPCASVVERNLLADTTKIVEKNKNHQKQKEDLRKMVAVGLSYLGYRSSICKSKWDKCPSYPAGEYEYVDVVVGEGGWERVLIDVDFRSEFEIARPTAAYKAVLQTLPQVFVGKLDRLGQIVGLVSEAAKQSLKKKGMPLPPWRKVEYLKAKWLSPTFTRLIDHHNDPETRQETQLPNHTSVDKFNSYAAPQVQSSGSGGELDLIFGQEEEEEEEVVVVVPEALVVVTWHPPAVRPKSVHRGEKVVTGLASLLKDKP